MKTRRLSGTGESSDPAGLRLKKKETHARLGLVDSVSLPS